MDWLELHIDTTHTGLEPVETMLSALGIDGVVIDDETEFHDFLESNRQYWDYVDENLEASMHGKSRVTFYLPADETGFAQMGEVRLALEDLKARRSDCGTLLLSLENLRDEDWENNWKQYYKPMEIGQRLLVIPQWEQVDPGQRVPLILDPAQHDYVTAAVSHLPHIIADSLVNLVRDKDSADGLMKMIAAGGFKDITRIASSSAAVWQQICLTNTENISTLLSSYIASLQGIQQELNAKSGDDLYELFDSARIYRDSFINTASGPLKSSYAITIDIADEPGEIAAVATILALKNISIKNIGIVHNREYEGGVLRIEFYQEEAIERSTKILCEKGYSLHNRK